MMYLMFDKPFCKYWYFELSTSMILLSPILMFRFNITSYIYASLWFILFVILFTVNTNLYVKSGYVFSLSDILLTKTLKEVMTNDMIDKAAIIKSSLVIVLYILVIIALRFTIKGKRYKRDNEKLVILGFIIIIISFISRTISYKVIEKDYYADLEGNKIVSKTSRYFKNSSFEKYGMLNQLSSNLDIFIFQDKSNKVIYEGSKNNQYTGLLEDYNIIEILLETGVPFTINETLTPNLYMLCNEGINFNNNYTKNKTNVSEYIGITGFGGNASDLSHNAPNSLPNLLKEKGYKSRYYHVNNGKFYNRKSLMKDIGFDEAYFYPEVYGENGPEFYTKWEWEGNYRPFDTTFVKDSIDVASFIPKNGEKFYTYWTTMTTHGPYNYGYENINMYKEMGLYDEISEAINDGLYDLPISKYYDSENKTYTGIFEGRTDYYEITNQLFCFEAEMMIFDMALGYIIDELKENDLFDSTLFVIYGDHEAYYISNKSRTPYPLGYYVNGTTNENNINLYETIMSFYNPKLNSMYKELNDTLDYDYFTSTNIIVPTILDLMGIKYNVNDYYGRSIFSDIDELDNIFYSHEIGKGFNNLCIATDINNVIYQKDDLKKGYKQEFKEKFQELIERINRIENTYC